MRMHKIQSPLLSGRRHCSRGNGIKSKESRSKVLQVIILTSCARLRRKRKLAQKESLSGRNDHKGLYVLSGSSKNTKKSIRSRMSGFKRKKNCWWIFIFPPLPTGSIHGCTQWTWHGEIRGLMVVCGSWRLFCRAEVRVNYI